METLHLNLKKQWYDMIGSGKKKEEYRDISDYWARRLVHVHHEIEGAAWVEFIEDLRDPNRRHKDWKECMEFFGASFHQFAKIHFKNGYSRAGSRVAPEFYIQLTGIRVGPGKEEWGAEPGKEYFVLVLGDIRPQATKEAS